MLFGLLTVLLMLAVPGLVICIAYVLPVEDFPTAHIIIVFAFVLQLLLCIKVEYMILLIIPFIVTLFGVLTCEGIYLASIVFAQSGSGSVTFGNMLLSFGIAIFGPEFVGIVAAFVVYAVIALVKSFIR